MNVRRVFPLVVFGAFLLSSCFQKMGEVEPCINAIPGAFVFCDKEYHASNHEKVTEADVGPLFGYFVNARDLDYWRSYDGDGSLNYVVDDSNHIKRSDLGEFFADRYELFYINESENLALFVVPSYIVYVPITSQQ